MERTEYKLLFTGQHTSLLDGIDVDYKIDIIENTNRLDSLVISCLSDFPKEEFSSVCVQGDTASAFACAVGAYHRGIPIIYLEAGLRSYDLDNPYPEEGYRQIISRLSNINLCPTQLSQQNLKNELVSGTTYIVGNTVLDNLVDITDRSYGNQILVTLHRRENHHLIEDWFTSIEKLAQTYTEYEFILPIHPNPNVQKHKHILKKVKVVEPLPHDKTIEIIKNCRLIISDSGGLQEEGSFFNKKIIVCRKTTERPEGLYSGHLILCDTPDKLFDTFTQVNENPYIDAPCPYGDGKSSKRIVDILNEII